MKTKIHPSYTEAHVRCTCGNEFTTRATRDELHVEVCSNCHPFYTGKQKLMDTGGRVERFQRRMAKGRSAGCPQGRRPDSVLAVGRCPPHWRPVARRRRQRRVGAVDCRQRQTADRRQLNAQRDAPVGGQAVLEGVMMRGVAHWAVAVRKPTPEQLRRSGSRRSATREEVRSRRRGRSRSRPSR